MIPELTLEQREQVVRRCVHQLGEVFQVVQVLCSSVRADGMTERFYLGDGNLYARLGMARELLDDDTAVTNAGRISRALQPPPDDGEAWEAQ